MIKDFGSKTPLQMVSALLQLPCLIIRIDII